MGEVNKQTFTIRVAESVAIVIEETARARGISPTALIQALVSKNFRSPESVPRAIETHTHDGLSVKIDALRKRLDACERCDRASLDQLRFEIVKTRAALLHSLDRSLGAAAVDEIIEASDRTAREYIAGLADDAERRP
jgi:hypothetical protein